MHQWQICVHLWTGWSNEYFEIDTVNPHVLYFHVYHMEKQDVLHHGDNYFGIWKKCVNGMNCGRCYFSKEPQHLRLHTLISITGISLSPFPYSYLHTHTFIAIRLIFSVCCNWFNCLSSCSKRIIDGNSETTRVRQLTAVCPICYQVTSCIFCLQNWPCIVFMKPPARIIHTLRFTDKCMQLRVHDMLRD